MAISTLVSEGCITQASFLAAGDVRVCCVYNLASDRAHFLPPIDVLSHVVVSECACGYPVSELCITSLAPAGAEHPLLVEKSCANQ